MGYNSEELTVTGDRFPGVLGVGSLRYIPSRLNHNFNTHGPHCSQQNNTQTAGVMKLGEPWMNVTLTGFRNRVSRRSESIETALKPYRVFEGNRWSLLSRYITSWCDVTANPFCILAG